MQTDIFLNGSTSDAGRRERIFAGGIFLFAETPAIKALREHAIALIDDAFGGRNPQSAQHDMAVEQFVEIAGPLKSRFTNDLRTKELMRALLEEHGCDIELTYFDVPRLRVVSAQGYLTSGVGYAYKPHRDTWYAAPSEQINWWFPVYALQPDQALVFHPEHWDVPLENSSASFDYTDWQNNGRTAATSQISKDTRNHPVPKASLRGEGLRFVTSAGTMVAFSSAQLHATAPNTTNATRFSIDFRTVNLDDVRAERGAPNIDSASTGSTIVDFISARDFSPIPDDVRERVLAAAGA